MTMRLSSFSVLIAMGVMLLLAFGTYYHTAAQAGQDAPTDRALGFEILAGEDGDHFFAVLMADDGGRLRVDVHDSKGELKARIELTEPRDASAPVRILPE